MALWSKQVFGSGTRKGWVIRGHVSPYLYLLGQPHRRGEEDEERRNQKTTRLRGPWGPWFPQLCCSCSTGWPSMYSRNVHWTEKITRHSSHQGKKGRLFWLKTQPKESLNNTGGKTEITPGRGGGRVTVSYSGSGTEAAGLKPWFWPLTSRMTEGLLLTFLSLFVSSSTRWNFCVWGCYKVEVLKLPSSTAKLKSVWLKYSVSSYLACILNRAFSTPAILTWVILCCAGVLWGYVAASWLLLRLTIQNLSKGATNTSFLQRTDKHTVVHIFMHPDNETLFRAKKKWASKARKRHGGTVNAHYAKWKKPLWKGYIHTVRSDALTFWDGQNCGDSE